MPRAKRPLAESDPNVQGSTEQAAENNKPKRQRVSAKSQFEQSSFTGNYEYVCISKPPYASEKDDDDDEDEDEDGDEESNSIWGKPASEHPEWKWIMLKESLDMLGATYQATDHRDPDSFDMYVYNDFLGYGIIEIIENMVQAFNKELKPQKGKKYNYQQMWAVVATLAHYLNRDLSMPWMMVDDGDRCARLNSLIGCMILTMLNELDRIGQLTSDSKFRDLGHVMALYLLWSTSANETTIEFSELSDVDDAGEEPEDVDWQEALVAYAEKININLAEQGVSGIQGVLDGINAAPLDGKAKAERWKWTPLLREYRTMHGYRKTILAGSAPLIGGEEFNIMKMSRQERADYAFDKVDPLAQFTDEEIASGKLTLQ